jgi:hypothetical protein
MALPEATEKIAWGEPTWRVRSKPRLLSSLGATALARKTPPSRAKNRRTR